MSDIFDDFYVIFKYTRADALHDGVLIDITKLAKEFGFKIPSAVTNNLVSEIDVQTQLPVLLRTFIEKIKFGHGLGEMISTETISVTGKLIEVILHVGGGDDGEPVLTLMLPEDM